MNIDAHSQTPLLVTFARPEESRAFRRRFDMKRSDCIGGIDTVANKVGSIDVIVAHTGIGPAAAEKTAASLLGKREWWLMIAAGFAGGLDPRLRVGDVVLEEHPYSPGSQRIVSRASPVTTTQEKSALFSATNAQAVDMETEALAAACARASLPLIAVRAISDAADTPLPVPFGVWFDADRQRARPLALVLHMLANPHRIGPFTRFVRALPRVSNALALAIEGAIRALEHH